MISDLGKRGLKFVILQTEAQNLGQKHKQVFKVSCFLNCIYFEILPPLMLKNDKMNSEKKEKSPLESRAWFHHCPHTALASERGL